jgi:hypothetical protein
MLQSKRGKTTPQNRSYNSGGSAEAETNSSQPPLHERPRSLTMGPALIFANAIGEREAVAIVNEWRPKFVCTVVSTLPEHVGWE